jgi:hypothetical protein
MDIVTASIRSAAKNDIPVIVELMLKKEAFGPHIMERWGWDEHLQRETHAERWAEKHCRRTGRPFASVSRRRHGFVVTSESDTHFLLLNGEKGRITANDAFERTVMYRRPRWVRPRNGALPVRQSAARLVAQLGR